MTLLVYLLVVVPLVGVATAAVWVPRPWQAGLLLGGPALSALAWAGVPGVELLGWLAVFGVPYALLVVLPVLPWRRRWARTTVPGTVLAVCAVLVAVARAEVSVVFYLALPASLAVGALVVAASTRRTGSHPRTEG